MRERKLEMERSACTTKAKIPELKITPFEGTRDLSTGFDLKISSGKLIQVDEQPVSDEEKYSYLLES